MEISPKFSVEDLSIFENDSLISSSESSLKADYVLKDLAAGSLAGIANVLSGHPFDTIKVRMQMMSTKLVPCVRTMIKKEGTGSLYKGVYSPLYSVPAINAVVFGAYESARRTLTKNSNSQELTITQGMIAGSWAGFLNCLIVTPVELIKCRQQMEGLGRKNHTTKSWALMRQIINRNGLSGLYKGNLITMLREVPAYAVQFASYEIIKNFLNTKYGESNFSSFLAGGVAGVVCWMISYPQDVIKTKLQCDFQGSQRRYNSHHLIKDGGIISCAEDIYKKEGFRGFWRGFSACTLRASIANAFTFVAYEEAKKLFL